MRLAQAQSKANVDALTGVKNKHAYLDEEEQLDRMIEEHCAPAFAIVIMDVNDLKKINDTLGHQMGDKVIQTAAKTILETLAIDYGEKWSFTERAVKEDLSFAGRLGGDEFVVFIRNLKSAEEVEEAFKKILKTLNDVRLEGVTGINASIGVTVLGKGDFDVDKAYSRADEALYRSKEGGRNRVSFSEEVKGVGKC